MVQKLGAGQKSGEDPKNAKVTLYLDPPNMIPVEKAFFVVGSKAKGTMTMKSKVAFAGSKEAKEFADACSGEVKPYSDALTLAKQSIYKENQMIVKRRLKKGKIVEPVAKQDKCLVCGMFPAAYPKYKSQIMTKDKKFYHFCSNHCMFKFLKKSKEFAGNEVQPFLIWVTDYQSGSWISGRTAYYVVGSSEKGPMGKDAFAFDKISDANQFADQKNGKVLIYQGVTIDKIM